MTTVEPELSTLIAERYSRVLEVVAASSRKAGRAAKSVRVVVVTKTHPLEVALAAVEAGAQILGENYAEEAVPKIEGLSERLAHGSRHPAVEWHMVGHVQSRKAQLVAQYFALVHSLDSAKLAHKLDQSAGKLGRALPVLLEFNVSGEAGKHGWLAADESHWAQLVAEAEAMTALPNLKVSGLMTMPPLSADPEAARIYFRRLRHLRDFLAKRLPKADWSELSMGTSADYAVAVEEGATLVRVGQVILGPRPQVDFE
jgi:hypothetical protein